MVTLLALRQIVNISVPTQWNSGRTPRFRDNTYSNNSTYKSTSFSSRQSLSTVREFLPENPNIYRYSEICAATNNFLAKPISSSSAAWKCTIKKKEAVIFQRKFRHRVETYELHERLLCICRSHHRCLTKLLGAAISGEHIYLVYEYVQGSNLSDLLRNPHNPSYSVLSTWMSRMQIATDVAQGLEYIHHSTGWNVAPVHNHIKSANVIVICPDFNVRICHFGTSNLAGELDTNDEVDEHSSSSFSSSMSPAKLKRCNSNKMKIEGSRDYLSPEYVSNGIISQKSDVFAFGIVLLEILSGDKPLKITFDEEKYDYKRISLVETARNSLNTPMFRLWIDRRLNDNFPVEIAKGMTKIALTCVDIDPERRPNMQNVAGKISSLYFESRNWTESMKKQTEASVFLDPR